MNILFRFWKFERKVKTKWINFIYFKCKMQLAILPFLQSHDVIVLLHIKMMERISPSIVITLAGSLWATQHKRMEIVNGQFARRKAFNRIRPPSGWGGQWIVQKSRYSTRYAMLRTTLLSTYTHTHNGNVWSGSRSYVFVCFLSNLAVRKFHSFEILFKKIRLKTTS